MQYVYAGQIKAARAMLNWTREELAVATGLSLNTIRNLEAGNMSPRHATNTIIRQVIESNGLELIDYEGVRRRPTDIHFYRGEHGCDEFYEDMVQTIKQQSGDICVMCKSPGMLAQSCGASDKNLERLEQLAAIAKIKCVLSEISDTSCTTKSIEYRAVQRHQASPTPYYIYGNRLVLVMPEGDAEYRFIIIQSAGNANNWRNHFLALWDVALPFKA